MSTTLIAGREPVLCGVLLAVVNLALLLLVMVAGADADSHGGCRILSATLGATSEGGRDGSSWLLMNHENESEKEKRK